VTLRISGLFRDVTVRISGLFRDAAIRTRNKFTLTDPDEGHGSQLADRCRLWELAKLAWLDGP
jgi:hypothetical protein